jgi:hypothetical protein
MKTIIVITLVVVNLIGLGVFIGYKQGRQSYEELERIAQGGCKLVWRANQFMCNYEAEDGVLDSIWVELNPELKEFDN